MNQHHFVIPGNWIAYGLVLPITVAGAIGWVLKGEVFVTFGSVFAGALAMALLSRCELPIGTEAKE